MIAQTTMDAWIHLQNSGRLNANQTIIIDIFRAVSPMAISNFDVSVMLGWPINRVTPRVNELVKLGKLARVGVKVQLETGRRVQLCCLAEDAYQYINFPSLGVESKTLNRTSSMSCVHLFSTPRQDTNNKKNMEE